MTVDNARTFQVGDRVRVRPRLAIPIKPHQVAACLSPFLYPGEIIQCDVSADSESAAFVVRLEPHQFERVWDLEQNFYADELHRHDCDCSECGLS
ncbi:hypothetical protein FB566_0874 [Stackebrandtia endophytica]|uniref:Uncharacterized protein n=1 Tax=Stackebrandtia endophytica TaxID=1496996 RepID=A0A543AS13_9ACTN|nr:hypothetical protein [Stackebrandtia endophytica]TQL75373.1 hypothetical protein FB566_0874 [Stackebrandtia endophytica]